MGNYYTNTIFRAGFVSLVRVSVSLVLVLVLVTSSTTFPIASADPNYCGPTLATDPNFPGYVDQALDLAVDELVSKNELLAGTAYPTPTKDIQDWAYAVATCSLGNSDACKACLGALLPILRGCSAYTKGLAYYDGRCLLQFALQSWSG